MDTADTVFFVQKLDLIDHRRWLTAPHATAGEKRIGAIAAVITAAALGFNSYALHIFIDPQIFPRV